MGKFEDPAPASGVYAAILTPRGNDSTDANVAIFLDYIDKICQARVNGIVLFGSTGEFVHYDIGDRMRVVGLAVKRSRVPVLVNVSHSSLQGAVDLAEQAETAGASGLLLMPPYFYKYEDGEIAEFYRAFLGEAGPGIPVYLYNLPLYTNGLSAELAGSLLESGRFAGIKDSSGSVLSFESLVEWKRRGKFQALAGSESILADAMRMGADGIISGLAAAVPELLVAAFEAFTSGDVAQQQVCTTRIAEFLVWVNQFPASVAIKFAADARGWLPAQLAVPLGAGARARAKEFRAWFLEWLPGVRS